MEELLNIKGASVRVRDWKAKDLKVFRYWNTGQHEWMKFNGPYYPQKSEAEINEHLHTLLAQIEEGKFPSPRSRVVIATNETDTLIGTLSWYWQSKETNWLSVGIAIYDHGFWGKGIGQEALEIWCQYLFDTLPEIVRLDLRTWSGNIGMMILAEKLGFQMEARFRKARIVDGQYYDSIGYGVLREEWLTGRPTKRPHER